jgi:hypothetical protein
VEEARKAVYEKNKLIGDMFNKQNEMRTELDNRELEVDRLKAEILRLRNRGQNEGEPLVE